MIAIAGFAGISAVLGTPVARHLLNDASFSVSLIPVWAFLGGAVYALAFYWLGGGLLWGASRRLGGLGSWQRSRHVIALAAAPLALSLVVFWPVRILVYGQNLFRTGGDDYGRGDTIFGAIFIAFVVWTGVLLLLGVRAVHGWTWAARRGRSGSQSRSRAGRPRVTSGSRFSNAALVLRHCVRVLLLRTSAPHLVGVAPERLDDHLAEVGVALTKRGEWPS